ncbi:hypothetical protein T484DRAFT_1911560 [Baffinella frigidus]|nr:hypothetical protein T484DRAFT_1911560 [Cryptophyta sp. CCMP2293]
MSATTSHAMPLDTAWMGLAGDSADLPAAKRATLASISLLYQSLEAATWKCIADLKRRDEEERQESRVIAELHPLKWVKRERMAATNLTSPRASPSSVGSPPEENAPAVPKTKTWLATPQLAPLVRPVLSFEEATAKAAKLDISQSISTPTPDAEYYKAEDMSELSI